MSFTVKAKDRSHSSGKFKLGAPVEIETNVSTKGHMYSDLYFL
jgi:hypothetical protein